MTVPIVTIEEGRLKGKIEHEFLGGSYYSFLGIPYAQAPIGDLRFKAPVPIKSWEGIRDATEEGPECPSRDMLFMFPIGAEDNCLNLNVYTKNLPNDKEPLKPVMVWIHAGGYLYGSNKKELYNPDYLLTEDIVFVSINYRIGVLGFLCLDDPELDIPGNAGLKDMVLALQWVQRNIKNFCGDPNNVTIFGESAGGASVHYLMMSPVAKGLFHKAIAQSGSCLNIWARGAKNGTIIAENLNFPETDEKKILEYLKQLPPEKIVTAQRKTADPFDARTLRPFGPVIEKKWSKAPFLTEDPVNIIKSGNFHHVPLIMGYTSREGMLFEGTKHLKISTGYRDETDFEYEIMYNPNLKMGSKESKEIAAEIQRFYFGDEQPTEKNTDKLYLLKTDNLFLYGIHEALSQQKLVSKTPIYFYKMTLETPTNLMKTICMTKHIYVLMVLYLIMRKLGDGIIKSFLLCLAHLLPQKEHPGTCHGDDLGFLFKAFINPNLESKSLQETYVRRFVKLWTNFAKTGDPTPDEDDSLLNIKWKPVTKQENLLLNIGSQLKMETDPDGQRMQLWREISKKYKLY